MAKTAMIETVTELEFRECPDCGVAYAVPVGFIRERKRDHRTWYCPNGHQLYFPDKNPEEILREQLERAQRATADWRVEAARVEAEREREKRSHAATKGQLTKVKTRIQNGVCPDCNRTFANLQRHMHTKHREVAHG